MHGELFCSIRARFSRPFQGNEVRIPVFRSGSWTSSGCGAKMWGMRKRIGEFLVEKGVITDAQVKQILKHSQENGMRFGDAGLELGILTSDRMVEVFGPSFAVDFFHLEAEYFPQVTRDLYPVDTLVRLGLLPLGFKVEKRLFRSKKILNLGLLDPSRRAAVDEALEAAVAKLGPREVQGVKVFLTLPDQFVTVLSQVYGQTAEQLKARDPARVDGTLALYLEHAG
jgi:hypothetical protein